MRLSWKDPSQRALFAIASSLVQLNLSPSSLFNHNTKNYHLSHFNNGVSATKKYTASFEVFYLMASSSTLKRLLLHLQNMGVKTPEDQNR